MSITGFEKETATAPFSASAVKSFIASKPAIVSFEKRIFPSELAVLSLILATPIPQNDDKSKLLFVPVAPITLFSNSASGILIILSFSSELIHSDTGTPA